MTTQVHTTSPDYKATAVLVDHPLYIAAAGMVREFLKDKGDLVAHFDHYALTREILDCLDVMESAQLPGDARAQTLADVLVQAHRVACDRKSVADARVALACYMGGSDEAGNSKHTRQALETAAISLGLIATH